MFKKLTLAALTASLLFGAIPAEAALTSNARSWQGIDLNGRSVQGRSIQGRSIQGRSIQGRSIQGVSLQGRSIQGRNLQGRSIQGTSLQGTEPDAASALQVVGVELPETAR